MFDVGCSTFAFNVQRPTSNVEVIVGCNVGRQDFGVGCSMLDVRRSPGSFRNFRHPADTPSGKQERAVAVFLDPHGFVQQKWEFLRQKGMSDNEILEALNTATGGEVVRAAGLDALSFEH
ncbi:MAG: hypothetical protein KJ072_14045 [Verrucomicrobia bacterium]|nr:hypothetical protein [Verrucomicrobiota bacterium]